MGPSRLASIAKENTDHQRTGRTVDERNDGEQNQSCPVSKYGMCITMRSYVALKKNMAESEKQDAVHDILVRADMLRFQMYASII